jgi:hypothetical protein
VANRTRRHKLLGALVVLTGLVACALNLDSTFVREVDLWARICIPAAFIVGLVGAGQRNRVVSIVTAVIGTIAPDESIRLTENPWVVRVWSVALVPLQCGGVSCQCLDALPVLGFDQCPGRHP